MASDRDEAFTEALQAVAEQPCSASRRWYDEHRAVVRQANELLAENTRQRQRQRLAELEHQILSLTLKEADLGDSDAHELRSIAGQHLRLVGPSPTSCASACASGAATPGQASRPPAQTPGGAPRQHGLRLSALPASVALAPHHPPHRAPWH